MSDSVSQEKDSPDQLWSMSLFGSNPDQSDARWLANQSAEAAIFRLFLVVTFCICFVICRFYIL